MMKNSTIIFDLDGTLVDTAPDLTDTLNHILSARNLAPVAPRDIRLMVGLGARKMIELGLASSNVQAEDAELDEMLEDFLAHYATNIAVHSKPFPGAVNQLEQMKAQGALLGICTNKRESLACSLLSALSLDHYFATIVGADTLPVRKPDPGHITGTVARAGGELSRSIMVGDSFADIKAAQAAGIPVVAVTFGYSEPDFDGLTPDATIDHFDDLAATITRLLEIG